MPNGLIVEVVEGLRMEPGDNKRVATVHRGKDCERHAGEYAARLSGGFVVAVRREQSVGNQDLSSGEPS